MFDVYLMAMLVMWTIVFISFATGAYKKSYSNIILITAIAIAVTAFRFGFGCFGLSSLIAGSIASTIRTMLHGIQDRWVRGEKCLR